LGEEDGARWDMHIVSEFLVLKEILCSIPGIAGYRSVDGTADGVFVAVDGVNH
jgi:hypothetical protein